MEEEEGLRDVISERDLMSKGLVVKDDEKVLL